MFKIGGSDMLSVREELVQYLKEQTGLEVYYYSPPVNVAISMPILILEEVDNSDYVYLYNGDVEHEVANVTYEVSIYSNNPADLFIYTPIIDKTMKRNGFKKSWTSGDNHVDPLYAKTLRFNAKIQLIDEGTYRVYR
jgi:hypothetical protein